MTTEGKKQGVSGNHTNSNFRLNSYAFSMNGKQINTRNYRFRSRSDVSPVKQKSSSGQSPSNSISICSLLKAGQGKFFSKKRYQFLYIKPFTCSSE